MIYHYDKAADALYLYMRPARPGDSSRTLRVSAEVALDFSKEGTLLGLEVLCASRITPWLVPHRHEPGPGNRCVVCRNGKASKIHRGMMYEQSYTGGERR